ncbi:LOW QUALITY PROTEIN: syntaxin-binding protein 5-like, partial [Portunus trituberculatus]|uniref:LOW QUALITY PROTEIN: syntaxin-binding protein 5-like n=1 Tax=Portunus trituberculatus TaxID=210409 RepID=UPI001E1CDBB2
SSKNVCPQLSFLNFIAVYLWYRCVSVFLALSDGIINPTLWVGTSLGSVIQITLLLPPVDIRATTPASVHPSGTIFRVKGSVLTMSFLDCNGALIPHQFESWKDAQRERKIDRTPPKAGMSAGTDSRMSPTNSGAGGAGDTEGAQTPPPNSWTERQFVVIASEKVARVVSLPTQNCVFKQILTDVSFVVKADVVTIKDSISLVCYIASGHISIFSLPSLRQLIYVDFLPLVDFSFQMCKRGIIDPMLSIWGQQMFTNQDTLQIARTFCFTHRGHGLYLCSPSEVQKFTISADFCNELQELLGNLFLPTDMPEAPKQSFFRGLFGGGISQLDREELFGESSGKPSRTLAKHVVAPNTPDAAALSARAGAATSDIGRAKMAAIERGQKLGDLEERTQRMMMESETFASQAHSLMMKYRDKKWYQL